VTEWDRDREGWGVEFGVWLEGTISLSWEKGACGALGSEGALRRQMQGLQGCELTE
jgi:hypothetical protein